MKKIKSKNTIMTVAEAGALGAIAKGYNVGVKYIHVGVDLETKQRMAELKGELSYSNFIAKLLGVEYEG